MITVQDNSTLSINAALQVIMREIEALKRRIEALEKKVS